VDVAQAIGVVVVGIAAGALSGMLGVGGAVLTTPGVRALGASPIEAIGSTIPAILPSAISGTYRYSRAGLVNWTIGLTCGITGSALALGGAVVSDHVNAHALLVITAVLLGWSGWSIYRSGRTRLLRIPVKEAIASSLVAVAIFSIPALVTHAVLGHINWAFAALLVIGTVPGAQIGSRITVGASDKTVRTLAGLFFVTLAVVYGTIELVAAF
jgi:uncharacterized membrane protein YfcA